MPDNHVEEERGRGTRDGFALELLREIGLERDIDALLSKILVALFRFVDADRGVILLKDADGTLKLDVRGLSLGAVTIEGRAGYDVVAGSCADGVVPEAAVILTVTTL